jgi:hypothetical protein
MAASLPRPFSAPAAEGSRATTAHGSSRIDQLPRVGKGEDWRVEFEMPGSTHTRKVLHGSALRFHD